MLIGKHDSELEALDFQGENLKATNLFKLLGLRFTNTLSIEPQINYLIFQRFTKHRGLINAVMYSKNRVNLLNLFQSLYYGQLQFSIETWPRLTPEQGNRLCREIVKPIMDIYGLPHYTGYED